MSQANDHDTLPPSQDPAVPDHIVDPPQTFSGILGRLGPGLIIAGSIVGSGELIATTKTGAQAGIALLWLIIIGCLIKVFVQIELGRYTISHGETTLAALDRVPGPRLRVNWIIWCWFVMSLATIGQLGGIVAGVGQSMAMTFPIKGDYLDAIRVPSSKDFERYIQWEDDLAAGSPELSQMPPERRERILRGHRVLQGRIDSLGDRGRLIVERIKNNEPLVDATTGASLVEPPTYDDKIWASVVAVLTAGLLYWGRYNFIQNISTVLVVSFTFITIGNVISLQTTAQWHISAAQFMEGLSFGPPAAMGQKNPWLTALATFGIIGVGASELIAYPYWCLEKGYAKFTGPRADDEGWVRRAKGWLKVMYYDAFASMIVYTIATLAFFLMGVAVLYNEGLDPDGMRMVSTLAEAYVPVFGVYAKWLFLLGAVAVLYSTFLVANAANARMYTDAVKVFRLMNPHSETSHNRAISIFSVMLPLMCLAVFCSGVNPVRIILIAGTMQALMLPIIGVGAIYLRYARTDPRLRPGLLWDMCLLVSFIGLSIAGIWGVISRFQ